MGRILAGVLAAAGWAAVLTPAAPVPRDRAESFFPAVKGTRWVYHVHDRNRPNAAPTREEKVVTAVERKPGETLVTVGFVAEPGETPDPPELLRETADGLYLVQKDGGGWDPPLRYITLPTRPGDTWKTDLLHSGTRWKGTSTAGKPEQVTVPAGKFLAVPVELDATMDGEAYTITNWHAAGVGRVKRVSVSKNWQTEQVLTKFSLGTD